MVSVDSILERLDRWIVDRPKTVVVAFLLVTAVLAAGLGGVSTDAGTSQFLDGVPAQEAFEEVNEEFGPGAFETDTGSTQLIQRSENVLSKPALLRMLALQERIAAQEDLRVTGTSSAAQIVARQLDPNATTLSAQQEAIRLATPGEVDAAVERAAAAPGFASLLSTDFNAEAATASATIGAVTHEVPGGVSSSAGTSGTSPLTDIQRSVEHIANAADGEFTVFGSGITSGELSGVIGDSLAIVVPAALVLILVFMLFAYRDPIDLLLGLVALGMTIVWTFGFMGLAGIPFGQMTIAVPVLLLAVGIDFGIHAINRYREERATGKGIRGSMRPTTDQLLVAFFIVTGTTVLGFAANLLSNLGPIRDFGLVAAIGIVFTFLIFGVFLPSLKILLDEWRERAGVPAFNSTPIGSGDSAFGRALTVGNWFAARAPKAFLGLLLVTSAAAGAYGTGVDTSFSQEDFLPPEDIPDYIEALPEPFAPGDYTVTKSLNFLEENFESAQGNTVTVFIDEPMRQDDSLEQIHRASQTPPPSFVTRDREAEASSIVSVIRSYARQDSQFAALVERNDLNDNGVPDDNLEAIYEYLLDSPVREQALSYVSEDFSTARVVYSTEASATQGEVTADGRAVAAEYRMTAIATGQTVVFAAITDIIFASAIQSLIAALVATGIFLVFVYWLLEGRPSLGVLNLIPIVVTVALLAGSMRLLDIPLNALTATVLSIAIGLGIDYSAHIVHRFAEEYDEKGEVHGALDDSVRGTGGALAGSMLTTTTGTGVLALAITPVLGQFGLVIALSVFFSFVASLLVTPSAAVIWDDIVA
ncbi:MULTISPECIES: RND family transporter [unclassified Haladaptatus]|uniref:efflux RND transporter permease subunit n=1 Tax=unclassified Haladaptatus TaxID=2622732 RepID=UPI0023E7D4B4|nr:MULTISPECIES: MMPL family transporter [unclassified Haladaptatus]